MNPSKRTREDRITDRVAASMNTNASAAAAAKQQSTQYTSAESQQRKQQRRPVLTAEARIPAVIAEKIESLAVSSVNSALAAEAGGDSSVVLPLRNLQRHTAALLVAPTPDQQLRLLSEVTMALRATLAADASVGRPVIVSYIASLVVPALFHVDLRYTHKAMQNIIRNIAKPDALLMSACVQRVDVALDDFITTAEGMVTTDVDKQAAMTALVGFVTNVLDALNVALMSFGEFSAVIASKSRRLLPVLGALLTRTLSLALQRVGNTAPSAEEAAIAVTTAADESQNAEGPSSEASSMCTVFGADLDRIRFVVRVVATVTHKLIDTVATELGNDVDGSVLRGLAALYDGTSAMLMSPLLPKDVLNAAGLLVATILTLRPPSAQRPGSEDAFFNSTQQVLLHISTVLASVSFKQAREATAEQQQQQQQQLSASMLTQLFANPVSLVTGHAELLGHFARYTPNGVLSFFRGLLSHAIAVARVLNTADDDEEHNAQRTTASGATKSAAVYCLDMLGLLVAADQTTGKSVLLDVIFPLALREARECEEPDTKFLALQTLDSCARHLATVFELVDEAVRGGRGGAKQRAPSFCVAQLPALRDFAERTIAIVIELMDDPTLHMSGSLYETYGQVLSLNDALQRCVADAVGDNAVLSVADALRSVLAMNVDRRGRYHALIAILPRIPFPAFVSAVVEAAAAPSATSAPQPTDVTLRKFVMEMLGAAVSCKVSAVIGEVFVAIAAAARETGASDDGASLWQTMVRRPLVDILFLQPSSGVEAASVEAAGDAGAPSADAHDDGENADQTSSSTTISPLAQAVITHMVTPLIKKYQNAFLHDFLLEIANVADSSAFGGVSAIVCEIASRARGVGINVIDLVDEDDCRADSALGTENEPASEQQARIAALVRRSIAEGLEAHDSSLRGVAFGLRILSTRGASKVSQAQCDAVVQFVKQNMHNGGDTTYRNSVINTLGRWFRRVKDSAVSIKSRRGDPTVQLGSGGGPTSMSAVDAANYDVPWARYLRMIAAHIATVIDVCVMSIATRDFSIERRFTALSIWLTAVSNIKEMVVSHPLSFSKSGDKGDSAVGVAPGANLAMLCALQEHLFLDESQWINLQAAKKTSSAPTGKELDIIREGIKQFNGACFPPKAIAYLYDTLSEGWDKIRGIAISLLRQIVAAQSSGSDLLLLNAGEGDFAANLQQNVSECTRLLGVPTFRASEGTVQRMELLLLLADFPIEPVSVVVAPSTSTSCRAEVGSGGAKGSGAGGAQRKRETALRVCECYVKHIDSFVAATRDLYLNGRLSEMFAAIHDTPLLGPLTVCGTFFRAYWDIRKKEVAAATDASEVDMDRVAAVTRAICQSCISVLDICTRLVSGGSTAGAGGGGEDADDGDGEVAGDIARQLLDDERMAGVAPDVDCRGHIISLHAGMTPEEQEAFNRVVVNNSWTGVRAATTVIEQLLSVVPFPNVALLPVALLEHLGFTLIRTLLRTKHNGVISRARHCLNFLCAALLRSRCDQHYALPFTFLRFLLGGEGVRSTDKSRILRRSQGLPHAIVPILEAEDPAVPYALFPMCMRDLLVVVAERTDGLSDGTGEGPEEDLATLHRVNALNVLKFILDDAVFATRVQQFTQDCFLIAARGFRHTHWAVRNSSLMVFSSTVHRVLGSNTCLHDLLSRMPVAMDFVASELRDAVNEAVSSSSTIHPALFPLLLMVSLLSPGAPHQSGSGMSGTVGEQIVASVVRCRTTRNLMARTASASALAALLPFESIATTISATIDSLPSLAQSSQNAVHGALLQVRCLYGTYVGAPFPQTAHKRNSIRGGVAAWLAASGIQTSGLVPHIAAATEDAVCRAFLASPESDARVATIARVAACPTTAKEYFSLVADVVVTRVTRFAGFSRPVAELAEAALRCAQRHIVDASQRIADRGNAGDLPQAISAAGQLVAASICLVMSSAGASASVASLQATIDDVLAAEVADARGTLSARAALQRSITIASVQALNEISRVVPGVLGEGCASLVARLRSTEAGLCDVILTAIIDRAGSAFASSPSSLALMDAVTAVLQFAALYRVDDARLLEKLPFLCRTWCQNSSVKHWAVRYIGRTAAPQLAANTASLAVDGLLELIWDHSDSREPFNARIASASSLRDLFNAMWRAGGSRSRAVATDESALGKPWFAKCTATLIVLLHDDEEPVRREACAAAAEFVGASRPLAQAASVEAVLSTIEAARRRRRDGAVGALRVLEAALSRVESGVVPHPSSHETTAKGSGQLFEEESENMFIELPTIRECFRRLRVALA